MKHFYKIIFVTTLAIFVLSAHAGRGKDQNPGQALFFKMNQLSSLGRHTISAYLKKIESHLNAHPDLIDELIEYEEEKNIVKATPLAYAILFTPDEKLIELLVKQYRANVNEQLPDGRLPLAIAICKQHDFAVKLLREHGAIPANMAFLDAAEEIASTGANSDISEDREKKASVNETQPLSEEEQQTEKESEEQEVQQKQQEQEVQQAAIRSEEVIPRGKRDLKQQLEEKLRGNRVSPPYNECPEIKISEEPVVEQTVLKNADESQLKENIPDEQQMRLYEELKSRLKQKPETQITDETDEGYAADFAHTLAQETDELWSDFIQTPFIKQLSMQQKVSDQEFEQRFMKYTKISLLLYDVLAKKSAEDGIDPEIKTFIDNAKNAAPWSAIYHVHKAAEQKSCVSAPKTQLSTDLTTDFSDENNRLKTHLQWLDDNVALSQDTKIIAYFAIWIGEQININKARVYWLQQRKGTIFGQHADNFCFSIKNEQALSKQLAQLINKIAEKHPNYKSEFLTLTRDIYKDKIAILEGIVS
ncbi:MAG: ankyrin repeat domain-containing protein [Endozoicomonadaceae bacterium]|nr:ankyrin repeat domain-containing protein [Endozoicomonadaceae bacterium]